MGGRDWTLIRENVGERVAGEKEKNLQSGRLKERPKITHRGIAGLEAVLASFWCGNSEFQMKGLKECDSSIPWGNALIGVTSSKHQTVVKLVKTLKLWGRETASVHLEAETI